MQRWSRAGKWRPRFGERGWAAGQPDHEEAVQESFPDDLGQSPEFNPEEPAPIPPGHECPRGALNSFLEFLSAPGADPSLECSTWLLYDGVALSKEHVPRIIAYLGWAACAATERRPDLIRYPGIWSNRRTECG